MDSKPTPLDAQYRAIIETSYPLFVIHTNHVTTLPDTSLFALCQQIYDAAFTHLNLTPYAHLLSLRDILSATFDSNHRAFVLDDSPDTQRILAALDVDSKGCIFAQAIAGIVSFVRTVAECRSPITRERVAAKLSRFEEGEERKAFLRAIETSPMWSDCFEKAQIGRMIMDAVHVQHDADVVDSIKTDATVSVVEVDDEVYKDLAFNDGPHLQRDLGVPDVFTIMALN